MSGIGEKIRSVFSWRTDAYSFDDEDYVRRPKESTISHGFISKTTSKRLSQVPVARNPSISSAQLNAAAPLVRVTRIPSTRFDSISEYQTVQESTVFKSTSLRASIKTKAKEIFSKPTTPKAKKSIKSISSATEVQSKNTVPSVKSEYSSTSRSSTSSVVLVNQTSKNSFAENSIKITGNQRDSAVNPKFLSRSNAFLKPKESEEPANSSRARNRSRVVSVPSPSSTTSNRSTKVGEQLLGSLAKKRGQGPSGSKHSSSSNHTQQLKSGSTASSSDNIDSTGIISKPPKHYQESKDRTDQKYRGSRDKLSSRESLDVKETTKHSFQQDSYNQPRLQSMPLIQQQQHVGNNNMIDQRDVSNYTVDPLAEINFDGPKEGARQQSRMQDLHSHIERLSREKMALESTVVELSSYKNEVVSLRSDMSKLQVSHDRGLNEMQRLADENQSLRNRLRDVVHSPLSDNEKQQIIDDSQRLHSSAPASIALPSNHENDGTPCVTPDWDKHSLSSEVSVACLQDKINQMEETHYSTNEELQATLQELADLQSQLAELQSDNDRLAEEKDVLFQSLCRQTEKLEDSRNQIGTLQELLLRESNVGENGTTEREQKLLDLLKNAQEERESLFIKQEELNSVLNEHRIQLENASIEQTRLKERISLLDSTLDANNAERKQIDAQLLQAREESASRQIEISRLTTLLENARAKIDEFEQDRALGDKSDLGELLDIARKEKDLLESEVALLQESLSKSQCEVKKLKDQIAGVVEKSKVERNNAKYALADLEYKFDSLKNDKLKLAADYQLLQDTANELQVQCKCHVEDKSQLENLLSETQRHLGDAEKKLAEKEESLAEEKKLRKQENEEWEQFQSDLLMTVRVANDFKTETQVAYENLVIDNKAQRDKIRNLEQEIVKLNKAAAQDTQTSLLNTVVQQEMAVRRQRVGISRQDSRLSVKSLIESIEKSQQHAKTNGPSSICSSTSSLNSLASDVLAPNNQNGRNQSEWNENVISQNQLNTPVVASITAKSPLREQQQTVGSNVSINGSQKGLISDFGKSDLHLLKRSNYANINGLQRIEKVVRQASDDPCVATYKSEKTLDFVRRSSCGDICERKDPLSALVKNGGSKRNALLKWCQNKTVGYRNIDITNFSSSWNDGLALCAILHSYLPDSVPYDTLGPCDKRRNFSIAFSAAESVGIQTSLNISECQQERPDWQQVMAYITAIYKHFET
ncbi:cytospin-A-like isoform X5 [Bradysia coprophila]|uniref:cytospin-A-like isoform X5 n=1 Tax=Bradysia coprophila TaxID=38358 RepID=UPI00187D9273|nr:cytospin-A-like isoform X5 [Bradysia coprophila]